MDELKQHLDDEARRVEAAPGALEALKRRAGRRRVTRQIGTGTLALAVAAGGFALAWNAFQSRPAGQPLVGPSMSPSPGAAPNILVAGPGSLQEEAKRLAVWLVLYGYSPDTILCPDCPVPESTTIQYRAEARAEAKSIRREVLPEAALQEVSWPAKRGDIYITLGMDYGELAIGTVRVRVLDAGGGRAATDTAAGQLRGAGYDVVEVADAPAGYDETVVACAPQHDEAGSRILEEFFPDADFRPELPSPDYDVTIYVGPDWAGD